MAVNWFNVAGNKTIEDGGYAGDLMKVARAHIEEAKAKGEITQQEAGQIYSSMIPSAFQTALQFEMQKEGADLDNEIKLVQRETAYAERIAKDKEAVKIGLDGQMKDINSKISDGSVEEIYTPRYDSGV